MKTRALLDNWGCNYSPIYLKKQQKTFLMFIFQYYFGPTTDVDGVFEYQNYVPTYLEISK